MRRVMWWKLMINVGMNQSSAVLGQPYGLFHHNADAQAIMNDLMAEVVAVAAAAGVNLTEQDIADWYDVLATLSPEGKTSMLQDIEAGRKTEVEVFAGSVVALGERYAVPTPINRTFLRLIRALEGAT
jgi:2-dehydropantoate 2-reductase